jgi:carotenoid cleavage dioxygenase-like enzyme
VRFGKNKQGGEPTFKAKSGARKEDDGYLMTYVYDDSKDKSEFWILSSSDLSIVAIVSLHVNDSLEHT